MAAADLRQNIIGLVQLLASKEKQLAYECDYPIADVPVELVCMWFDDLYHPQWDLFVDAFSHKERVRLARFHTFYDLRVERLPDTLAEMHDSDVWNEVMTEAQQVLEDLGWATSGQSSSAKD